MKKVLFCSLAIAAAMVFAVDVNADVVTSYGTVSGADDANQAGPNFGQSITINVGADTADGLIPATVFLKEVQFQSTSSVTGLGTGNAFLHVYDAFAVDGTVNPTTIGNLVAVSTNTVTLEALAPLATMTWAFSGLDGISKSTSYAYVLANNTTAATVGSSTNLLTHAFELNTGNPYTGGQALRANGTTDSWDNEFRVTTATVAVPEPTSLALLGMGLVGLVACRRRR